LVRNNSELEFQRQADRPPTAKTLYAMAGILATQGKNAQCEFVLNRIIQDYPRFLPAYNSLAEVQMRQGRVNAAIETISGGLRIRPRDPVLLNNLGMCRIVHKDYEKALEAFTEAAGVVPENARYRTNMALALGLMGRYEESLSLFKQVLPEDQANHNLNILREAGAAQGVLPLSPPKPAESDNTSR
jgi:serine/threonine-protein kinase